MSCELALSIFATQVSVMRQDVAPRLTHTESLLFAQRIISLPLEES